MVPRTRNTSRTQRGLTLIELMLAVTLGLLVSTVVLSLYINTSRSLAQNERYAWMQENARFALKALSEDLTMADFWGRVIATDVIGTNVTPPTGDCGEDIDIYDAGAAIMVNNYHVSPASTHFSPCADLTDDQRANTDFLALKRVEGSSTASTFIDAADIDGDSNTTEILTLGASDLSSGDVYLRSTASTGTFIDDASSSNPPGTGQTDWRYTPRIYFVRDHYETAGDQIPALCRLVISGTGLATTECIAEGIEDFHVQFGVDTDGDAIANLYTSTPTLSELENAVSARLYLLARSIDADPHFTNDTQYVLGDATVAAASDGFYRRVYSTTVSLRNSASRSLMQ
jgi:type IV pilus assembly protein PilW